MGMELMYVYVYVYIHPSDFSKHFSISSQGTIL